MSKIRILPENIANQIAAGEVVERPASVVKECVENSIDAGARRIEIHVAGSGVRSIRIVDDGEGMDEDDILLSLERHATSKLSAGSDLVAIRSLGFRGEALPSIASVARLAITSRCGDNPLGTRVVVRFGKVLEVTEMGCARGTVVDVSDLFDNVPARKKFLKTPATESSHMEDVVKNYCLAYPHIGFLYVADGRTVFSFSPGAERIEERWLRLFGRGADHPLMQVRHDGGGESAGAIRVQGFLAPPDVGIAGAAGLRLFVNNRAVKDRMVAHAVAEGMHTFLMKGRRPVGAIFIEVPNGEVDVNVHPTKQEVRFQRAGVVHQIIALAVRKAVEASQKKVRQDLFGIPGDVETEISRAIGSDPSREILLSTHRGGGAAAGPETKRLRQDCNKAEKKIHHGESMEPSPAYASREKISAAPSVVNSLAMPPLKENLTIPGSSPLMSGSSMRYIGQLHNAFLLCETPEGMAVIDQHAAQERLIFEKMKNQYMEGGMATQQLLFPVLVEMNPEESELIAIYNDELTRLGLDLAPFGGNAYTINGVPALMGHLAPEEILSGLVASFIDRDERWGNGAARMEGILSDLACKAALKGGDPLTLREGVALVGQIMKADIFSHCPHGRPVVKLFSGGEIKKWFYRA